MGRLEDELAVGKYTLLFFSLDALHTIDIGSHMQTDLHFSSSLFSHFTYIREKVSFVDLVGMPHLPQNSRQRQYKNSRCGEGPIERRKQNLTVETPDSSVFGGSPLALARSRPLVGSLFETFRLVYPKNC